MSEWIKPAGMSLERAMQIAQAVADGKRVAGPQDAPYVKPGRRGTHTTDPVRIEECQQLLRQGRTVEDVTRLLNMSNKTVRKYRDLAGIPAHPRGRHPVNY